MTSNIKKRLLTVDGILAGYRAVSVLYPYVPSMLIWRAWEYAAYKGYSLPEPILDVGCGDGNYFRLVWPDKKEVIGIDIDAATVQSALSSGVYRHVQLASALDLPFEAEHFASVFANCSLEHMDHLSEVLQDICRCLRPGGEFLFSVVTDKFLKWDMLPLLLEILEEPGKAELVRSDYAAYHHLVNPLTVEGWVSQLTDAGFMVEEYIPIVPELTGRLFLFLDHLLHVRHGETELGDLLPATFAASPNFISGLEMVLRGFLEMERDWLTCCGVVFWARKFKF